MASKKKRPKHPPNLVDEQLERYREMRDFSKTAEPSGKAGGKLQPTREGALFPSSFRSMRPRGCITTFASGCTECSRAGP